MAYLANIARVAAAALAAPSLYLVSTSAEEAKEPDPWFTQDHRKNYEEETETQTNALPGQELEQEKAVVIRRSNPSTLVRRLKKELGSVPENNLGKRIALLEQIIDTAQPKQEDVAELEAANQRRSAALNAITQAGAAKLDVEQAIDLLAPHARYYIGDPELLVTLLKSDFSNRLDAQVSSLSRRNQSSQLAQLKSQIDQAGLQRVFGSRIQSSASDAASSLLARRWAELLNPSDALPGEAYLVGKMLGQPVDKIALAVKMPAAADPRIADSLMRGLNTQWGTTFTFVEPDQRGLKPALVLGIGFDGVEAQQRSTAVTKESVIPGAIVEEPNPDFLDLVDEYEKAADKYQVAVRNYELEYERYVEAMSDNKYDQAQSDLKQANEALDRIPIDGTPGGASAQAYAMAREYAQAMQSVANSIAPPAAIEPTPPHPYHLEILDNINLVPSTIIISAEETPYEYTEKKLDYEFTADASLQLTTPFAATIDAKANVALDQKRNWIANENVHPRDPTVTEGTYSEGEYQSALDIFGLEFATRCANKLGDLLEAARQQLPRDPDANSLPQSMLALSLRTATSGGDELRLSPSELEKLQALALDPETDAKTLRSACLALLFSKTGFPNLADEAKLTQLL